MQENTISWTWQNMITVTLMVFVTFAAVGAVWNVVRAARKPAATEETATA